MIEIGFRGTLPAPPAGAFLISQPDCLIDMSREMAYLGANLIFGNYSIKIK
jgi:hypothetical protein